MTNEHWKLILQALPTLVADAEDAYEVERVAANDELEGRKAALSLARDAVQAKPKHAPTVNAYHEAKEQAVAAKGVATAARLKLEQIGSIEGQLGCLREHWSQLGDANTLVEFVEAKEIARGELDHARAATALYKKRADLDKRKAAR